jgi:hypothetical protein
VATYNQESLESELYCFKALGILPRDILLCENDMIGYECRSPEIILKDGTCIEVKRIFSAQRKVDRPKEKFNRKRFKNRWHWLSTIYFGLNKITDRLIENVLNDTGIKIQRNILVVLMPFSIAGKESNRIIRKCIDVYNSQDSFIIKTKMFFLFGDESLFSDLR